MSKITKEELIEFLKKELDIQLSYIFYGGDDNPELRVKLYLGDEIIADDCVQIRV